MGLRTCWQGLFSFLSVRATSGKQRVGWGLQRENRNKDGGYLGLTHGQPVLVDQSMPPIGETMHASTWVAALSDIDIKDLTKQCLWAAQEYYHPSES